MKTLFFASLLLVSCASRPAFQRLEGGHGYLVKESAVKEVVEVHLEYAGSIEEKYREDYLIRAIGEECSSRGFSYFDFGVVTETTMKGICYPAGVKTTIGVQIDPKFSTGKEARLQVLEPAEGMPGPFKPWDVIRKIGGQEVSTIGALKEKIFLVAREKPRTVSLLVERSGIPISVEAPLVERKDALMGPETLTLLRERVK